MRTVLRAIFAIVAVVVVLVVTVIAVAVARESQPLTGDALRADPAAHDYLVAEQRALAAAGVHATVVDVTTKSGMRMHGFTVGEGPPVVLIHGGGGTAANWIPLLAALHDDHHKYIALDRPGCGLTDGFDYDGVDLHAHALDVVGQELDALGVDKAVLVGNSMGALWSIWFAEAHPERVAALAFLGTPATVLGTTAPKGLRMLGAPFIGQLMGLSTPTPERMKRILAGSLGQHAVDVTSPELLEVAVQSRRVPGGARSFRTLAAATTDRNGIRAGFPAPTRDDFARLHAPAVLVWGDADVFADAGFPQRLKEAMPAAAVVVVPGAGHCPWIDDPGSSGAALAKLLSTAGW